MIRNQIEAAERRAEHRCPVRVEKNTFWKRVDVSIEQQSDAVRNAKECSDSLLSACNAMTGKQK